MAELVADVSRVSTCCTVCCTVSSCPSFCRACVAGDEVTPEERSALHTVGAAGLVSFVSVYDSLESAAKYVERA